MQFHQNGFQPGDPRFDDPQDRVIPPPVKRPLPKQVDVLIVGCGPAGLNLAAQLSRFAGITTCIVDQKDDRLLVGQADGIACRTMEMFQAYGFAEQVVQEAYQVNETVFWKPDADNPECIIRSSRIQDVEDDLSEMPHVILNQARVHDMFLDVMRQGAGKLEPYYSRRVLDVQVADNDDEFPVTVTLEKLVNYSQFSQITETVKARYVIGCDGARSTVRRCIGRKLVGDSINQAWGVMDVLAVTDFPDIRFKNAIYSAKEGNMLIIPREGGYMVRLYIELDRLKENERINRDEITADYLIDAANRILQPYSIDVREVAWWSVYEIGQRLTTAFDDSEEGKQPRVFLAGDACHTHSPKAGQGMNTSVMDTWNLGWKLAHVLTGRSDASLLDSYSAERQHVAQQLIDFDRDFSKMFSAKPKSAENPDGVDPAEFQRVFEQFGRFTAGTAIQYPPSLLTGSNQHQHLASGEVIGMRFHSAPVIRQADAKPMQLGHCIEADGRWHLFVFAGRETPMSSTCRVRLLCEHLADTSNSPLVRCTPANTDPDSVVDVRAVFQCHHHDMETGSIHPVLAPLKGELGLRDYEKVFCPHEPGSGQDIYSMRGIDRDQGCIVVVRPDQYVANVLVLDDIAALNRFLAGFLLPAE